MKKILIITFGLLSLYSSYILFAANEVTPPANCIQYTDECGNMCIKKRNDTRSCNKKISCSVYQHYMCVAIVNDVDLDENKNKIIKTKYIPQMFGSLYTNNQLSTANNSNITINPNTGIPEIYSPDLKGNTSTGSTTDTITQSCNNEDKPVCGMIPLVCTKAPCFPIIQNYENECIAKAEGALYIQPGSCSVKRNIKKGTVGAE